MPWKLGPLKKPRRGTWLKLDDHFRRGYSVEGVNVLSPDIHEEADSGWPSPTTMLGPYVVKEPGQVDSEAIAVQVDVRHFLTSHRVPRHVSPDP
ncbi:MAG: hypothetical protein AMXMBFR33_17530 [Candidatus Xenobia bacterium]